MIGTNVRQAIIQAFKSELDGGVTNQNLHKGFTTASWHTPEKPDFKMKFGIRVSRLPQTVHDFFISTDNPYSRLTAVMNLEVSCSECGHDADNNLFAAANSVNSLALGSSCGLIVELTQVLTEGEPENNEDCNMIRLSKSDELLIANDLLDLVLAYDQPSIFEIALRYHNDNPLLNFCSTFD